MRPIHILMAAAAAAAAIAPADAGTVKYYARSYLSGMTTQAAPPSSPSYTYAVTSYGAWGSCTNSVQTRSVTGCQRSDGQSVDPSFCSSVASTTQPCGVQCATLTPSRQPVATTGWVDVATHVTDPEVAREKCTDYVNNTTPHNGLCWWNSTTGEAREYNSGSITSAASTIYASSCP